MDRSESIGELAGALAKAQGKIRDAVKDQENPFFKSSYATLSSIWNAARGPLSENGLSVVQLTRIDGDDLFLDTLLLHASGEWIGSEYPLRPVKNDPQGIGSALTYARRYALSAMVGITADEDDDGNEGSGNKAEVTPKAKPAQMPVKSEPTNGTTAKPEQKPVHAMPPRAAIKTVRFGPRMKELHAKLLGAGIAKYATKDGGIDFDHAQMSAAAEKFESITDENLDAVMAALERRATTSPVR